jgi:hypothetical protein
MSLGTVGEKPWRAIVFEAREDMKDLHDRLDALEEWAKSRIRHCDDEIAKHDGTLRVDGKVVATYPDEGLMGRIDQGVRIRAGAEKQALEVVLRMLNGELEAP